MDFGRALFGPLGGAFFAFMVAFSCFGALNGEWLSSVSSLRGLTSHLRLFLYVRSTRICCRTGTIFTGCLRKTPSHSPYPLKRSLTAISHHRCFYIGRKRVQVTHKFFGRCCLVVLLPDGEHIRRSFFLRLFLIMKSFRC